MTTCKQNPDIHRTKWNGKPAIFGAVKCDNLEIIRCLVQHGADLNARTSNRRATLLMHAAFHNSKHSIRFLLQLGVDLHATDYKGRTALFYSCIGHNAIDAVKLLLPRYPSTNVVADDGYTPLRHAIDSGSIDVVNHLLSHDAGELHVCIGKIYLST